MTDDRPAPQPRPSISDTENPRPAPSDASSGSPVGPTPGSIRLVGSERRPLTGVEFTPAPPQQEIEVTLVLRRRAPLPDGDTVLSRAELAERYGALPADISAVTDSVTAGGATVLDTDPASRRIRIRGSVGVLEAMFGTKLFRTQDTGAASGTQRSIRARQGSLRVPAALDGVLTAVLGLDDRPQSRTRLRMAPAAAVEVSYTPVELGRIYDFPANTDGTGQTVAVIELGGGFAAADLDAYFGTLGLKTPSVSSVGVDGGANTPGKDAAGADGEVLLDIEVVGALANGADIVVYFAPNTDAGFLDAVSTAAHAQITPTAMSISWGQSEDEWTAQARTAMDEAFADAAALGVTVTAAAGDDGSTDRATDRQEHCDFPASSPHVLACGGTSLRADAGTGAVRSEVVWNNGSGHGATGGGVSRAFPLPDWQQAVGVPTPKSGPAGRGVPDVAAVADPRTGYRVRVDGSDQVIGGTSAVAPLWAALTARLAQGLGRPLRQLALPLYAASKSGKVPAGLRDITDGDNGGYRAGPGWDACTGLGVPVGTDLLAALRAAGPVVPPSDPVPPDGKKDPGPGGRHHHHRRG